MALRDDVAKAIYLSCPYADQWPAWEDAEPVVHEEFLRNADAAISHIDRYLIDRDGWGGLP